MKYKSIIFIILLLHSIFRKSMLWSFFNTLRKVHINSLCIKTCVCNQDDEASKHWEEILPFKYFFHCIVYWLIQSSMYVQLNHCPLWISYFVVRLISFSDLLGVLVVPRCQSELVVLLDSTQFRAPWWKRVQWWNHPVSIAGWLKPAPPIDAGRRGVGLNQTVNIETSDLHLCDKSPFLLWRILDK